MSQDIDDLPSIDMRDLGRLSADAHVIRVPNPDPFARRARAVKRARKEAAPELQRPDHAQASATSHTVQSPRAKKLWLSLASSFMKWGLRTFFYHPDALRPWANGVANSATNEIIQGTHAILSSSPAYSCHMAGLSLKLKTGLPWVADFRDLWVGRPYRTYHSAWHKWVDEKLEAKVVKHCDCLVLASPAWEQAFVSRYGESIREKITVLTNGYEAEFFEQIRADTPAHQAGHKFVLTGSMHEAESPLPFLEALRMIRSQDPDALDDVEVTFIGNAGDHLPDLKAAAAHTGIGDRIVFLPPRSNEECIKAQLAADYLIMFSAPGHEDTIRGKSFEYMATGKPILACVPEVGIQADILNNAGNAIVVQHGDTQATAAAILSLLKGKSAHLQPNWPYIQQFDRAQLSAKLAKLLDRLLTR
jgi:glycosyltransferase involved in cell wall biosynthesis